MIKQIKKIGNGNALFLDRAILELVGLEEGGEVQLTVRDGAIIVTPTHPRPVDKARFDAALKRVMTERRDVLRKLAE
jgi:antitoxin component of MazEF toxin-antitoxin module